MSEHDDAGPVQGPPPPPPEERAEDEMVLAAHHPLREEDPPKVGDFWLDARLTATPAGTTFVAHEDGGDSVMLLLLSEGAARDAAARARFSGEINAMHIDTVVARGGEDQDDGRTAVRYRSEDDDPHLAHLLPLAPWAALAFDGTLAAVEEADRVLRAVDLSMAPPLSQPAGPDYRLHWIDKTGHGATRLWPLAWPGRRDRASWITILVSFLVMALLSALALLMAILAFQNQPPVDAPPPIPSPAEGSGEGSGSPDPASASPQSGEPQSREPSSPSPGSDGGPYSDSPSMEVPSDGDSGPGGPSVNPKL
ncbi:hypothetical protein H5392_05935 [Tessaracoccus sp. MC1865]|uniref:hypothetical protein n=1 Tax=Tessaracoccus sp. MC1865 TaxID=2760310 RepID=UPI0015FFFEB4|nr:hypothetical protein [Tessaracoccus sp. MC1865]MBB1483400.1 hypothetical protein [Tessaracoccus sp. MC1865]QTO36506.1 hypothetical protein J7D54_08310 [Tessaracoccus sp. MC1865]